jgi:hypothetical protein
LVNTSGLRYTIKEAFRTRDRGPVPELGGQRGDRAI